MWTLQSRIFSGAKEPTVSAIEFLKRQHREVEQLFEQLKVSDDDRERLHLLGNLAETLTLHSALEERRFYPLCQELGLVDDVRRSLEEHGEMKRLISRMLQLKRRDPSLMPTVERLQERVEAHVEEEETSLFPQVKAAADDAVLDRLGEQMESDAPALLDEDLLEGDADQPSP